MNRYSPADLSARLAAHLAGLAAPTPPPRVPNVVQLPLRGVASVFAGRTLPNMAAAAAAGLPSWFDGLPTAAKNSLVAAALAVLAKIADAPRAEWLRLLFAVSDAGRRGATDAYRFFLAFSAAGRTFNQAETDRDWKSSRPGGVEVGTMLDMASKAGLDLTLWLHATPALPLAPATLHSTVGFMQSLPTGAANLHPPPWVMLGLLVRGDNTIIAGQGGTAKTAVAVSLAVALAACRTGWGPFKVTPRADGTPLRVLYMSGEEDANRLGLLVEAACRALGLTPAERASVNANFIVHDARASEWRLGEPRPGEREDMAPEGDDRMRDLLRDALPPGLIDVVVMDTVAGLLALTNENDNNAATRLLNRLARVARIANCAVLLIHHAPKSSREGAAAQRGEATLVRGGGAFVNSARVAWSLTGLPLLEAAAVSVGGANPDAVRRLDPVKINDCAPPPPAFLEVAGVMVPVSDGSQHSIRAVRFIPPPPDPTSAGGLPTATLNVAMRAIDAGVTVDGVRLPLSPGGGRNNNRDATQHIARALRAASPTLPEAHARTIAKQALGYLRDKLGCVQVHDMVLPQQANGKANGRKSAKALVCRWDLAPWPDAAAATASGPAEPHGSGSPDA